MPPNLHVNVSQTSFEKDANAVACPPSHPSGKHFLARAIRFSISTFLALLFFTGCVTNKQSLFTATGPEWHTEQGQALWRPKNGMPEFGGDLVIARDNTGRCVIQFDKTPMAILSAQVTSNRWLIRFPQRNLGFSGHGTGPTRFAWLYLPRALDGKPLPKKFRFEQKADGGWSLENTDTGEKLEGFLAP